MTGCAPRQASWWIAFEPTSLRGRAQTIEASIVRGGCSGTDVVYAADFDVDAVAPTPPALAPGTYGFSARARDAECTWFAATCVEVQLPIAGVSLNLTPIAESRGTCSPDAGTGDAGARDAAQVDSPSDAAITLPSLIPSNVPRETFRAPGSVELSSSTLDTDACESLAGDPVVVAQDGGPELCVLRATDLTIASGETVAVIGSRPLVILALGHVVIDGVLDGSAHGRTPGPGGGAGGTTTRAPEGASPGGGGGHVGTYDDGGGGGGGACGAGGSGGVGDSAASGPGGAVLAASSSPLRGGSGGGVGGGGESQGPGGAGGGGLQITAGIDVVVRGQIFVSGGGGRGGSDGTSGDNNIGSGGGGGSGGTLLIEAPVVTIEASARLWAAGGGGGGGSGCRNAGSGSSGSDGRNPDVARPAGGDRGPTCSGGFNVGSPGGAGGGGTVLSGTAGTDQHSDAGSGGNGGGGGGGAGCIEVRSQSGMLPASVVTSPSADPGWRATSATFAP